MQATKRIFTYIFLINYLIAIVGIPVSTGYCGKKIQQVVVGVQTHTCKGCKKAKSKSCCTDSVNFLKLDIKQNSSKFASVLNFFNPGVPIIPVHRNFISSNADFFIFLKKVNISLPEKLYQPPIYLKNRSFII